MPAATVLIPTHNHVETLRYSVTSVLRQTLSDLELFIVGDGIGDATRATIAELAANDGRVRLFDFPKGDRKGERHRHEALKEARGRIVAYLGDDDLWMPRHLETLDALLGDADFANTLHIGMDEAGRMFWLASDLADPQCRGRMLHDPPLNTFDLSFGGHTLAAYRRLGIGWAPPPPPRPADHRFPIYRWLLGPYPLPPPCPADLYLWRQFLAEPWCRARSATVPTGICTQTHRRPNMSDHERAEELARLAATLTKPEAWQALVARVTAMPAGKSLE